MVWKMNSLDFASDLVLDPRSSQKKVAARFLFTQENVSAITSRPDLQSYLVLVYHDKRRLRPINVNHVNVVYKRRL